MAIVEIGKKYSAKKWRNLGIVRGDLSEAGGGSNLGRGNSPCKGPVVRRNRGGTAGRPMKRLGHSTGPGWTGELWRFYGGRELIQVSGIS